MQASYLPPELADPPREASQAPFWFWNDELSEDELRRQLADFQDHGVHAFVIHPRAGLPRHIGWLSDRMLHFMRFTVYEAARRGMWVILYDEGMYPSGSSAGQVVAENPAFACRGLVGIDLDVVRAGCAVEGCRIDDGGRLSLEADQYLVAAVNRQQDGHRIAVVDLPTGSFIRGLHYIDEHAARRPDHIEVPENTPPAADLLNPEAVSCFIRLVYDRLAGALGKYFGSTIRAIFTDEPKPLAKGAPRKGFHPVPGTTGILAHVSRLLGYDFTPHLPALWDDGEPDASRHRKAYHRAIESRLAETYFRPISQWCDEHGIALTGHPASPEDIGHLRFFQWPGQDIVLRSIEPGKPSALEGAQSTQAKCASSAMVHDGRRRNANEYCGAYGHDFTFAEMRWLAGWLLARGCNLLLPHAFYYSVRGPRIDERPPDVGPHAPWWAEFRQFSEGCSRVCWLNTDSRQVCRIAVLASSRSLSWQVPRFLFRNQWDFNYLEDRRLWEEARVDEGGIHLAGMSYDVLIREMADDKPVSDRAEFALRSLDQTGRLLRWHEQRDEQVILDSLDQLIPRDIRITPGAPSLRCRHVSKGEQHYYILFNEGQKGIAGEIEISVPGRPLVFDPFTLEQQDWPDDSRIALSSHQLVVIRVVKESFL